MDPEKLSKDTLCEKSETVNKADCLGSSLETDHSPTDCDTTLIDLINDKDTEGYDTTVFTKEFDDSPEGSAKKTKASTDESPSVSKPEKSQASEESSSVTIAKKSALEARLDEIGIRGNIAPKFPHYSKLKDRLQSYSSWTNQNQPPSVLSEAGFFFIGEEDRTACFFCGGGLREWKSTDDPWIEHAHWFPKCNFVLNVKGQEYIDQAWRSKLNITIPKEIKNAADALKDLFDVINPKLKNDSRKEKVSLPKPVVASENTSLTCVVCYQGERDVLFMPCRHLASCNRCALALTRCVLCRASINSMILIHV